MKKPEHVLLIYPPLNNIVFFGTFEPLVLEIFSSIAKQEGCKVELIDVRFDPKGLENLAGKGYSPDLIGLATHGYSEVSIVNELARTCRSIWPHAVITVGGGQATITPELFDATAYDYLVKGPGENLWRRFCREGLSRQSEYQLIQDDHVSKEYTFPTPDRGISEKYRQHYRLTRGGGRAAFIVMTQGCPFRCTFCAIWPASLKLYRLRVIDEIVTEMKSIKEDYVYIGDDNTFANYNFANRLADEFIAAGIYKKMVTACRADHISKHPELFEKWASIGLKEIIIGIEATSDEQLEQFNKAANVADNIKAIQILKQCGIRPIVHLLVPPHWNHADFDRLYDFIIEYRIETPIIIPLTPIPGTKDYKMYKEKGEIVTESEEFFTFNFNVLKPKHMGLKAFDHAYDRFEKRVYSLKRYFGGYCGDIKFMEYLRWYIFIRIYLLYLRKRRKKLYKLINPALL